MTTSRARARADMEARILAAGQEQLAERGAAALSLREIARSLGVVSSAVYRYVASRDELLTLLLVDAYGDLADAVDSAVAATDSPRAALTALARTLRTWGRAHPAQWALLYGSPVPGYAAPAERTSGPGKRVTATLLAIAVLGAPRRHAPSDPYARFLSAGTQDLCTPASPAQAAAAVETWAALVGAVSTEIFGQLGPIAPEAGAEILDDIASAQAERLGLP